VRCRGHSLCIRAPSKQLHQAHLAARVLCAEHIKVACQIMTSCVLLGGRDFLRDNGQRLASSLTALTGTVNERGTLMLLPVEELLLQVQSLMTRSARSCGFRRMLFVLLQPAPSLNAIQQTRASLAGLPEQRLLEAPAPLSIVPLSSQQVHPTEAPALLEPALRKLLEAVLLGKESSLIVSGAPARLAVGIVPCGWPLSH